MSYAAGDDGAYQIGTPWPNPRFIVNGNGTITDRLTGLMWEQAQSGTSATWTAAFERVNTLNTTKMGGYSDWRLPNMNELFSLINYGQIGLSWLMLQGFIGLGVNKTYWSSTSKNTDQAWGKLLENGIIGGNAEDKTNQNYVIGVRGGQ
jgi:hypothetical protein